MIWFKRLLAEKNWATIIFSNGYIWFYQIFDSIRYIDGGIYFFASHRKFWAIDKLFFDIKKFWELQEIIVDFELFDIEKNTQTRDKISF